MKKILTSLLLSLCAVATLSAMDYEEAREQARFLTDKMAYELNLNDQQYNDCYEINLDYLLNVRYERDIYGDYLTYRNSDLRHILYDWQYSLFMAADYFFRPLTWYRGAWFFPIYRHYHVGHYYYHHPAVYYSYRGGHGRYYHRAGFYASRRPHWDGGFRGPERGAISHRGGMGHPGGSRPDAHRPGGSRPDAHRPGGSPAGHHLTGTPHRDTHTSAGSNYGHPSSTRTTVHGGTSDSRPSGSRPSGFTGGRSTGSAQNRTGMGTPSYGGASTRSAGSAPSMGGSRSAGSAPSMGGGYGGSSRGGATGGARGSSRGGGRGR